MNRHYYRRKCRLRARVPAGGIDWVTACGWRGGRVAEGSVLRDNELHLCAGLDVAKLARVRMRLRSAK